MIVSQAGVLKFYDRKHKKEIEAELIPDGEDNSQYSSLSNESCRLGNYIFNVYIDTQGTNLWY